MPMRTPPVGVLIMAYGSAPSLDDEAIFGYLRHILQYYRKIDPKQEEFQHLKERYQAIGGSPLYSITENIIRAVQSAFALRSPERFRVYMAMKHSSPFVEDVVGRMAQDGVERAIAVALVPFRSRLSTDGYYRLVRETNTRLDKPILWSFVDDWNLHPLFLQLWQNRIEDALRLHDQSPAVIFTNHSLPAQIRKWKDPYSDQFEATAKALAEKCRLSKWTLAYQSEGGGNQPWLGPDLVAVLQEWKGRGHERFLVAPIGFLMDHLETLYDLDVEAQSEATEMGIELSRTPMPNDDPLLVALLTDVIVGVRA